MSIIEVKHLRKETRDFVFRVRSWNWEIHSVDYDYPAMISSLQGFCARQFLGRSITLKCQLAIEEITSSVLIPPAPGGDVKSVIPGAFLSVSKRVTITFGIASDDSENFQALRHSKAGEPVKQSAKTDSLPKIQTAVLLKNEINRI